VPGQLGTVPGNAPGRCDAFTIVEGSDEAVLTALCKAGSLGNVRRETMRYFSIDEAKRLIGNLP